MNLSRSPFAFFAIMAMPVTARPVTPPKSPPRRKSSHATDQIWQQLNPVLWERSRNPWVVLQTVLCDKLERDLADPAFRKNVDR